LTFPRDVYQQEFKEYLIFLKEILRNDDRDELIHSDGRLSSDCNLKRGRYVVAPPLAGNPDPAFFWGNLLSLPGGTDTGDLGSP
jgi:hypothetical protein